MTAPILSVPQKLYIACRETFKAPTTQIAVAAVAFTAIASSAFRHGLYTSPLGMATSFGLDAFAGSKNGRKIFKRLPPMPSKLEGLFEKISRQFQKILSKNVQMNCAIWAPIVEEVIFRGAVQTTASALLGPITGIVFTSLAFSAVHYQEEAPSQVLNSFLAGVTLGALKEKVSILASIGYHIGINSFWTIGLGFNSPEGGILKHYMEAEYLEQKAKTHIPHPAPQVKINLRNCLKIS